VKILVAGSTGAIGRRLVPMLIEAGHDVLGMTHDASRDRLIRGLGAEPVVVNVFDRDGLCSLLQIERPDAVMHQLTSLSSGDYVANARIRTEGTRNMVDAALSAGVKRLVAQSYCIYRPGEGLAREETPLDLDSPRLGSSARAILDMEVELSRVPQGVVLRYGALYGPGTGYSSTGAFADQVRRGEIEATDDVVSFVHVDDAARAALLALAWPKGLVNIVDDEPAPGTEWLPAYAEALGALPPPVRHGDGPPARGVSNSKARNLLGWQPLYPSWRQGFKKAL
jgi:nucleoside-diphosphate-sugar epimerase